MIYLKFLFLLILIGCGSHNDKSFKEENHSTNTFGQNRRPQTDTINRPFNVTFKYLRKVQKEPPYNSYNYCDIILSGAGKIQIPETKWQDKFAWTNDSKSLVLVEWSETENVPAFVLVKVNTETGEIKKSIKMAGAINTLDISEKSVRYNKFFHNKVMSKDTLCCIIEEDYIFN
jgi:hypothetical protein